MNKERAAKNISTAVAMYHAAAALSVEFEKAMRGTEEERVRILPFHLSIGIPQVFGIETALKALIRRQGKNPPNIHNLRKLYDMLAPETQKSISEKSAAIDIRGKRNSNEHPGRGGAGRASEQLSAMALQGGRKRSAGSHWSASRNTPSPDPDIPREVRSRGQPGRKKTGNTKPTARNANKGYRIL